MMAAIGTLATKSFEITDKWYQLFTDHKEELAVEDVYYGPQGLIPRYPCVIVEPRPKTRRFNGTRRWDIQFNVVILLYHGKVVDSETLHRENEEAAGVVENFMHQYLNLDGLVLFGYVTAMEPGVVSRGDVMVSATRLTWQGDSREEF